MDVNDSYTFAALRNGRRAMIGSPCAGKHLESKEVKLPL
jgi:hypothetical protein